ncbi:flagellar motor switch protein FliN/FliY [Rhizobium binae]|uniref:Flagellar motor switch protein FliN n=1 Tax=Rhizobium binae TaxID=1138190 RepID=A0ABV2MB72_9HYPH
MLKQDADGDLSQFGGDLENDAFGAGTDLAAFGGEISDSPFGGDDFGGDFGAGNAGTDFGGSSSFEASPAPLGSALTSNFELIMDIPIDVQIMLGTSRMQVSGLMNLNEGATIALDKKIGEPVEIMVNGRRIARGEITVLDNDDTRFGVKLIEVMSTKKA